jgi:DNA-directed RNA polymerase subunit N (RpoN/RPB10)
LLAQSVTRAFPDAAVPGAGSLAGLLPHLDDLLVDRVTCAGVGGVVIEARCGSAGAACPACGSWSSRVHSGYARTVADGPAAGRAVLNRLRVRRFFCGNQVCEAVTFAEQVDGLTGRYCQRSAISPG